MTLEGLRFQKSAYFHSFEPCFDSENVQNLIINYCAGAFVNSRVVLVQRPTSGRRTKSVKYLLTTQDKYINREMKDIISIPECLYYLQMLEQGKFSVVYRDEIDEQLRMFSVSKEPQISLTVDELEKWHKSNFPMEPFESTLKQVDEMSLVYKRMDRK